MRLVLALAFAWLAGAAEAAPAVDVALVLAVDTSGSIDASEFELQRAGYAAAFRDQRVIEAIRSGPHRAIAVTYFQWSEPRLQQQVIEWTVIGDDESTLVFADRLAAAPRQIFSGGTSVSGAIDYGAALLAQSGVEANRRVIDLSGDGSNNVGRLAEYARDDAVAAGITINALAILSDETLLDIWYRDNAIGGAGAFVVAVADFEAFAPALLNKLIREIAQMPTGRELRASASPTVP
jgi:hypothetical protein